HRTHRERVSRPLGCGEHALVARCRVQGRSVALPHWARRKEHGGRPPLRPRPRPQPQSQRKHQDAPKAGRMEHGFPAAGAAVAALTWIPCRALAATRKRHAHLLAQKQLEEQNSTEFPNGGRNPFPNAPKTCARTKPVSV